MTPRGGFDELRFPDDLACTVTREAYMRAQEAADAEGEVVRVSSGLGEQPSGMRLA